MLTCNKQRAKPNPETGELDKVACGGALAARRARGPDARICTVCKQLYCVRCGGQLNKTAEGYTCPADCSGVAMAALRKAGLVVALLFALLAPPANADTVAPVRVTIVSSSPSARLLEVVEGEAASTYVRRGGDQMAGALGFRDGSATLPSIYNVGDRDTGILFPADGRVGISNNGTLRWAWTETGVFYPDTAGLDIATSGNRAGNIWSQGSIQSNSADTTSAAIAATGAGYYNAEGVATASLTTCDAAHAGWWTFNTTKSTMTFCSGSGWTEMGPQELLTYSAYAPINAEDTDFWGTEVGGAGAVSTSVTLTFMPTTAGVGAGSAVLELEEGGVAACTLTFSCTAAVGTTVSATLSCSDQAIAPNAALTLNWDAAGGCTTQPIGNVTVQLNY